MKSAPSPLLISVGFFLTASLLALADTVTLKSGEALEGKILSETDQQIVMDVTVASGITDQKTLAKSDVRSVSKTSPDEIAYQAIKGYRVESRSLPADSYMTRVRALEAFLQKYPQSSRAKDVQATLSVFKEEQEKVRAKCIKWNNCWYTPEEFEKNKYQLRAQMQLATMREQASRRDFVGALNTFDQIEKAFPGSMAYPDAIELAKGILPLAASDMERLGVAAKNQETQFNTGIVLVPEPQKSQMIAARQAQIAAVEAAVAAAERAGVKWKPFAPIASKSTEALKTTLATEGPRLEALPLAAMRASIASVKDAEAARKDRNPAGADAKSTDAQTLWSQNNQLVALSAEIEAFKKKPAPTPTPAPKSGEASATEGAAATPTPKPKGAFSFF